MNKNIEEALSQITLAEYIKYSDELKKSKYPIAIKAGGECLTEDLVDSLKVLHKLNLYPILVHGGQRQINDALKAKGIVPKMKENGKRKTDEQTLDVVVETLQKVNWDFVERLNQKETCARGYWDVFYGTPAEEYSGDADRIVESEINQCLERELIPILAPLAKKISNGGYFNQNADSAFSLVVSKFNPKKVIMLTNIGGVYYDPKDKTTLISRMTESDLQLFLNSRKDLGGMKPKLEEAQKLVEAGHDVQITSPEHLLLELFTEKGYGTYLHKRN